MAQGRRGRQPTSESNNKTSPVPRSDGKGSRSHSNGVVGKLSGCFLGSAKKLNGTVEIKCAGAVLVSLPIAKFTLGCIAPCIDRKTACVGKKQGNKFYFCLSLFSEQRPNAHFLVEMPHREDGTRTHKPTDLRGEMQPRAIATPRALANASPGASPLYPLAFTIRLVVAASSPPSSNSPWSLPPPAIAAEWSPSSGPNTLLLSTK